MSPGKSISEILSGPPPAEDSATVDSGVTTSLSDGAGASEQNPSLATSTDAANGDEAEVTDVGANVTSVTVPSGYEISYCPDPRGYKIDGVEVPSVTTVLDILHKSALPYWGNKIGAEGVLELVRRGLLVWAE